MKRFRPTACGAYLGMLLVPALIGCASGGGHRRPDGIPSGWPVAYGRVTVTAEFGERRGSTRHDGIDLAAPSGTPVWTTADGRVIVAEREQRYGRTVVVDHGGGYRTRYAHLKRIDTRKGRKVRRGDVVGRVGASGNASGPHLHYEVLKNGVPVNPRPYLD